MSASPPERRDPVAALCDNSFTLIVSSDLPNCDAFIVMLSICTLSFVNHSPRDVIGVTLKYNLQYPIHN